MTQLRCLLTLGLTAILVACGGQETQTATPELLDLPSGQSIEQSLYLAQSSASARQYIRNYLLNHYGELHQGYDEPQIAGVGDFGEMTDTSATVSTTNTIEPDVDEADIVKAFSVGHQNFLVTVLQPQWNDYDTKPVAIESSETITPWPSDETFEPAALHLYRIGSGAFSELLQHVPLGADSHFIHGLYQQGERFIVKSSAQRQPSHWQSPLAWVSGATLLTAISHQDEELSPDWQLKFDGHPVASRRIDGSLYLLMRHAVYPEELYSPGGNPEVLDSNIKRIHSMPVDEWIPGYRSGTVSKPAFDLKSCYLPDDNERFLSGGMVFSYLVQVDLERGVIGKVQCVLSDINQVYVNSKSIFLIDSNGWKEQKSRIHRFDLKSLSYDNSVEVEGDLGWISPQFRIRELDDGTLVLVTSQFNASASTSGIDLVSGLTHKLRLYQKGAAMHSRYQMVSELPNAAHPESDGSPLSLGKPGEQIYGVRINDAMVSVVTFQTTDPLYQFDISDRSNPFSAGELHQDGVSVYLHQFDELTLGVGYDATSNGRRKGLKVELYGPAANGLDIESLDQFILGQQASTAVEWDHKAFSSVAETNGLYRIVIPAQLYFEQSRSDIAGLMLFRLNSQSRNLLLDGYLPGNADSGDDDRAIILGDTVHYWQQRQLKSYLWTQALGLDAR